MDLNKLDEIIASEPKYRSTQVRQAIYKDLIENWEQASSLPKNLREKLAFECQLDIKCKIFKSADKKTIKALIELRDGAKIETVFMRHQDGRHTICVSSQVGCPLGCLFCATGEMGYKRNLTSDEIIEQVILFMRYIKKELKEQIETINIVFMGMGEPFLNYDNVMAAIKIFNNKNYFNIGARHISISTCGIIEGIKKLYKEKLQLNLAISLHAPNNNLRSKLMPINKKYSLPNVLSAVDEYIKNTNRKVMIEYTMIDGVNDLPEHARELAELFKKKLVVINLIVYNQTGGFKPSSIQKIKKFMTILKERGINVTQRYHFGGNIKAACGQLATD